jgi:hypothetical protein
VVFLGGSLRIVDPELLPKPINQIWNDSESGCAFVREYLFDNKITPAIPDDSDFSLNEEWDDRSDRGPEL